MPSTKLHERLLELPLFQGMSRNDLEEVVTSTKFCNLSYAKGKVVVNENEVCDKLFFLVKGSIYAIGYADDHGYSITETFSAPEILQPERIFGLTQRYSRTFKTKTDCMFISLGKMETLELAEKYEIFRLNMLNIICTKDIRHKIARFIEKRCLRPAGEKTVHIKMERLSDELSESRLNISRELNAMDAEGIISLRRGEIYISALERIIRS